MLLDGWVCSTTFLDRRLPRATARIFDLRRQGYLISRRQCESHDWHETTQYEWKIEAVPAKVAGESCLVCGGIQGYVSTCPGRQDASALPGLGGT